MNEISILEKQCNDEWIEEICFVYHSEWERIEAEVRSGIRPLHCIPRMEDIVERVFWELHTMERMELIENAIKRHDDQLFGYSTPEQFMEAAWSGHIPDHALQPKIEKDAVLMQVIDFVFEQNLFVLDFNDQIRHAPLKEVW